METPPGLKWKLDCRDSIPESAQRKGFRRTVRDASKSAEGKGCATAPIRNRVPVPSVRILPGDMFARKPCGGRAVAFQWNYYERHQKAAAFHVFAVFCFGRAVVWPATSFQLA